MENGYVCGGGIKIRRDDDNHDNDDNDANNSSPSNNDSPNFIDEEELKEEMLRELLDDKDTSGEEEKGENPDSTENEEEAVKEEEKDRDVEIKEEDTTEKEEKDKTYKCVCGFETSDWKEIDKHRAFCDEFQRLQALEAKKTMDALFGKHDEEKDVEEESSKPKLHKPTGKPRKIWKDEDERVDISEYAKEVFANLRKIEFNSEKEFDDFLGRELERIADVGNWNVKSKENNTQNGIRYVKIRVLEDLPPFVGLDEKIYTLKAGEVAKVPEINASILIRHGKAVEVGKGDFG